jgi:hypothetical protein
VLKKTRKMTVGLVAVVALGAALVAPGIASGSDPATPLTACGNIAKLNVSNIQADGVPCDKARQVAKEYVRQLKDVAGFQCRHQRRGRNSNFATCTQGEKRVTFYFRK